MGSGQVARLLEGGTLVFEGLGALTITRKGVLRPQTVVHFIPSDTLVRAIQEFDDGDGEERSCRPAPQPNDQDGGSRLPAVRRAP
jgi:hypothetical protein